MRNPVLRGAAILYCVLCGLGNAYAAESMKWAKSFPEAMAEAKKSDKLVLVDFYTDWSGPSRKLTAETCTDKKVIALSEKMVVVKVEAEKEGRAEAAKYSITGFPTVLFLEADGSVVGKIVGYEPAVRFAEKMTQALDAHTDTPLLEQAVRKGNAPEAAAKLAAIYAGQDRIEKALAMLALAEKGETIRNTALPAAYNALGDAYQENKKFDSAILYFRKAIAAGKTPRETTYAHLSIAFCYLQQEKLKEALPEFEATLAVPDGPEDLKILAQSWLKKVKAKVDEDK